MKVFRYSKVEYRNRYRRWYLSHTLAQKDVKLTRKATDNKTCRLRLLGYPLAPRVFNVGDEEMYATFLEHLALDKPDMLAVQVDPMPYLYTARQFAVDHLADKKDS